MPPVRAKKKKYKVKEKSHGWAVCGFDVSMSSIAGAAIGYDETLKKFKGPSFSLLRWEKEDEYFDRLREACNSQDQVMGLISDLGMILDMKEIHLFQEEPWPLGITRGGASAYMKQQAEISGAFLGGLMRWGYTSVAQMNSHSWRKMVADALGITTHHSKWRDPKLAGEFNCTPADSGKFRSKQWALALAHGLEGWDIASLFDEIPDWPDVINNKKDGKIPRPEGSTAKAVQPDDRYDALAVMWTGVRELVQLGVIELPT